MVDSQRGALPASNTLDESELAQGRTAVESLRTVMVELEAELRHPDLPPKLSSLAVRGVTLATGWSLSSWRENLDAWSAALEGGNSPAGEYGPAAHEWVQRLEKLKSFMVTAAREARHMGTEISADPDAEAVLGKQGQDVVEEAIAWFKRSQTTAAQVVVNVENLVKRYGSIAAVDGVTLSIPQGQIFGLLGPNSAGKTTLLECIEGVRTPDSGTLRVLGRSYKDQATAIRERVGVQLQTTGFFELLTVRETLKFFARLYPRRTDVDELLSRLAIDMHAKSAVRDLSGGIRQRLALAVALVNDPELVFLDEPTTGLDPQARQVVWQIVRSLRETGTTVVLTTHSMEEAEQLCDRVAIMTSGRIRVDGPPSELVRGRVGESVVEVVAPPGEDRAHVRALPGILDSIDRGERMVIRTEDPPELVSRILALRTPPMDVRVRRGTVEDVFFLVTEMDGQS